VSIYHTRHEVPDQADGENLGSQAPLCSFFSLYGSAYLLQKYPLHHVSSSNGSIRGIIRRCFGGIARSRLELATVRDLSKSTVGGCWLYSNVVPVGDAFVIEFVATTLLLFFAFGVGLDSRQRQMIGPSLALG
jgi:hypothetical protein